MLLNNDKDKANLIMLSQCGEKGRYGDLSIEDLEIFMCPFQGCKMGKVSFFLLWWRKSWSRSDYKVIKVEKHCHLGVEKRPQKDDGGDFFFFCNSIWPWLFVWLKLLWLKKAGKRQPAAASKAKITIQLWPNSSRKRDSPALWWEEMNVLTWLKAGKHLWQFSNPFNSDRWPH